MQKFIFEQSDPVESQEKSVDEKPSVKEDGPKTWDTPDRGRKKCPKCVSTYVPVRCKNCPKCSHEFGMKVVRLAKPLSEIEHKSSLPVGARAMPPELPADNLPARAEVDLPSIKHPLGIDTISTPGGACPINLKGTEKEIVIDWIEKVSKFCLEKRHERLLPSALQYYVRYFYDIHSESEKYAQVCKIIVEHCAAKNITVSVPKELRNSSPSEYCEYGDF